MYHNTRNKMGRFAPGGKAVKAFAPKAVVAAAAVEAAPEVAVVNPIPDQAYSFAVNYVRKDQVKDGVVAANPRNPSVRRFATEKDARNHALRFVKEQGHRGYWLSRTNDRPNAWINPKTGLTNPALKRR